ncbi:MAG TPA: hypothetical protein VHZ51_08180 [Ktedonobacteraceae bacterium]|nr:hypothetical protein [Ktedonobacter sp. SOSP1-85]HEX4204160.1 hypothetical protein [Ktedonobacteraceae bacterium]
MRHRVGVRLAVQHTPTVMVSSPWCQKRRSLLSTGFGHPINLFN